MAEDLILSDIKPDRLVAASFASHGLTFKPLSDTFPNGTGRKPKLRRSAGVVKCSPFSGQPVASSDFRCTYYNKDLNLVVVTYPSTNAGDPTLDFTKSGVYKNGERIAWTPDNSGVCRAITAYKDVDGVKWVLFLMCAKDKNSISLVRAEYRAGQYTNWTTLGSWTKAALYPGLSSGQLADYYFYRAYFSDDGTKLVVNLATINTGFFKAGYVVFNIPAFTVVTATEVVIPSIPASYPVDNVYTEDTTYEADGTTVATQHTDYHTTAAYSYTYNSDWLIAEAYYVGDVLTFARVKVVIEASYTYDDRQIFDYVNGSPPVGVHTRLATSNLSRVYTSSYESGSGINKTYTLSITESTSVNNPGSGTTWSATSVVTESGTPAMMIFPKEGYAVTFDKTANATASWTGAGGPWVFSTQTQTDTHNLISPRSAEGAAYGPAVSSYNAVAESPPTFEMTNLSGNPVANNEHFNKDFTVSGSNFIISARLERLFKSDPQSLLDQKRYFNFDVFGDIEMFCAVKSTLPLTASEPSGSGNASGVAGQFFKWLRDGATWVAPETVAGVELAGGTPRYLDVCKV